MPLQLSTDKNLVDKFKEAYSESLAETAAKAAGLLNKQGLAAELNCSVRTIDNLIERRAIPYLKIGRLIRFRLEDVRRALQKRYTIREFMEPGTAERSPDMQETIRLEFAEEVPSEVWEALEAVKPFIEAQYQRPQVEISSSGTGSVRPR